MAKSVPTASFRRPVKPSPEAMDAFVSLDDAPGDTPLSAVPLRSVPNAPVSPSGFHGAEREAIDLTPTENDGTAKDVTKSEKKPARSRERSSSSPTSKWRRKTLQRSDGRELRKQTFYLDAELSHRLMVRCAEREYDLSEAAEEAFNLWLKKS